MWRDCGITDTPPDTWVRKPMTYYIDVSTVSGLCSKVENLWMEKECIHYFRFTFEVSVVKLFECILQEGNRKLTSVHVKENVHGHILYQR